MRKVINPNEDVIKKRHIISYKANSPNFVSINIKMQTFTFFYLKKHGGVNTEQLTFIDSANIDKKYNSIRRRYIII